MVTLDTYFKNIEKYRNEPLSAQDEELIGTAFQLGRKYHAGQLRASGEDYFNSHCLAVSYNVASLNMDSDMIAAALLHDTLEDTELTKQQIIRSCGQDVADMVDGVSKLSKVQYKGNDRHAESLRKFFVAIAKDARVVILKLCDRWHNLETLLYLPPDKQVRIAQESILIHAQLASRLGMGKLASMLRDLAFPYAYPEDYEKTREIIEDALRHASLVIASIDTQLTPLCEQSLGYKPTFDRRIKGVYSVYKKLQRKQWNVHELHDLVALRIIVKTVDDCYKVLGAVHAKWQPMPGRIKDYIALPKPNGYRSLHTTILNEGMAVEVQIRTHAMHTFNEYGIASHHSYKDRHYGESRESFDWISQLSALKDERLTPDEYIHELHSDFFEDRIFALTPKGDVIDLPIGATVLDFAYAVHSDIGDTAQGGRINGKYVALSTEVPSESIVEIVTSSKNKPSEKWLEWVKTSHAKTKIKKHVLANHKAKTM